MIIKLHKKYPCCYKLPIISNIDTEIFSIKYFASCMECGFCHDSCCSFGVDIDIYNVKKIQEHASTLEAYVGIQRKEWFKEEYVFDNEFPGGKYVRTKAINGACVFLDRKERGCLIHKFCIEKHIDYHELKPIVSCLFPITFDEGLLHPSDEVGDNSLICLREGLSLYQGVKNDLLYYFGQEFINELDAIEATIIEKA